MDGWVPIFFLMVVLKIPVGALLYLVWWAFRASTAEEAPGGEQEDPFRRFRRDPKRPKGPRRGDHGPDAIPVPECPPAGRAHVFTPPAPVRVATARAAQRGSAEPVER